MFVLLSRAVLPFSFRLLLFYFFYVLVILFCIFALVNQASDMTFGCPATDA